MENKSIKSVPSPAYSKGPISPERRKDLEVARIDLLKRIAILDKRDEVKKIMDENSVLNDELAKLFKEETGRIDEKRANEIKNRRSEINSIFEDNRKKYLDLSANLDGAITEITRLNKLLSEIDEELGRK